MVEDLERWLEFYKMTKTKRVKQKSNRVSGRATR